MRSARVGSALSLATALALGLPTGLAGTASAGEIGHFGAAVADIRDYIMPADPTLAFKLYTYYYNTNTFKDRDGDEVSEIDLPIGGSVDVDVDVDVFVVAPAIVWVSPWEILGARYGAYMTPTFGNSSVDASLTTLRGFGVSSSESDFGVGDLFVQPVWLGWDYTHWDFAVGYGFYAPIGEFEQGATDNIGLGFWTHQLQASAAWYPDEQRLTAVVAVVTYEYNGNVEGIDLQPGQRINVNLGVDHMIPLGGSGFVLDLGAVVYGQWQITDDKGSDATSPDVHDQVYAIGPQVGLTYVPWKAAVTAKWLHEFEAENRFEGDNFTLNFGVAF